jgi:hypothetical protein
MEPKVRHFMYVPWTGLGLYGGFRGNRWLKNRIKVFKEFVWRSLEKQTGQNFVLWCSWRPEEKRNPIVQGFIEDLELMRLWNEQKGPTFRVVHTFHGVCFWDDKYPDPVARGRLLSSLHGSIGELLDTVGEVDYVYMTIQPSDDCYALRAVDSIQKLFNNTPDLQALGFSKGYVANYRTKEVAEYNPETNPPFFTVKFPRDVFCDPLKHADYTGPYKSHEYVGDHLKYETFPLRLFLVGTHGENISTVFNHPYKGEAVSQEVLKDFGIYDAPVLKISLSPRKWLLRKFPHKVQRKLRYWFGEKLYQRWYEFLRS